MSSSVVSVLFETIAENSSERLDICATHEFELFSRSQFKHRVLFATVNGKPAKASLSIKAGDHIRVEYLPERSCSIEAEDIPLNIIYEDQNVLVVNKIRGMVVHPGAGNPASTLVNAFLFHCRLCPKESDFQEEQAIFRPGIVHRLDKDTTGVIILAKNDSSLEFLSRQFRERQTKKQYLALVAGYLSEGGEIRGYIRRSTRHRTRFVHDEQRGKSAHSLFRPLANTQAPVATTLMELSPVTGRTHQLRVHMQKLGHPILGDDLYNPRPGGFPLMLHAQSLSIELPAGRGLQTFTAQLPADMKKICTQFNLHPTRS